MDKQCRGRERRCGGIAGEHSTADRQYADHSRRGVIGPASDGYAADEALSTKDAFAYHREQADVLARTMSIFSTRQLFRHSRNCMALPERWQERAAHMRWRPCCIPMVRCSMERHWRKRSRASMLRSLQFRITT